MIEVLLLTIAFATFPMKEKFEKIYESYEKISPAVASLTTSLKALDDPYARLDAALALVQSQIYGPKGPYLDSVSRLAGGYAGAAASDAANLITGMKGITQELSGFTGNTTEAGKSTMIKYMHALQQLANSTFVNQWFNQRLLATRANWFLNRANAVSRNLSVFATEEFEKVVNEAQRKAAETLTSFKTLSDGLASINSSLEGDAANALKSIKAAADAQVAEGVKRLADHADQVLLNFQDYSDFQIDTLSKNIQAAIESERVAATANSVQWFENLSNQVSEFRLKAQMAQDDAVSAAGRSALDAAAKNELQGAESIDAIKYEHSRIADAAVKISDATRLVKEMAAEADSHASSVLDRIDESKIRAIQNIRETWLERHTEFFDGLTDLVAERDEVEKTAIARSNEEVKNGASRVSNLKSNLANDQLDFLIDLIALLDSIDNLKRFYESLIGKEMKSSLAIQAGNAKNAESKLLSTASELVKTATNGDKANSKVVAAGKTRSSDFINKLLEMYYASGADLVTTRSKVDIAVTENAKQLAKLADKSFRDGAEATKEIGEIIAHQQRLKSGVNISVSEYQRLHANAANLAADVARNISRLLEEYVWALRNRSDSSTAAALSTFQGELDGKAKNSLQQLKALDAKFRATILRFTSALEVYQRSLEKSKNKLSNRFLGFGDFLKDRNSSMSDEVEDFKNELYDKMNAASVSLESAEALDISKASSDRSAFLTRVVTDLDSTQVRRILADASKVVREISYAENELESGKAAIFRKGLKFNESMKNLNDSIITRSAQLQSEIKKIPGYRQALNNEYVKGLNATNFGNITLSRQITDLGLLFSSSVSAALPKLSERLENISDAFYDSTLKLLNLTAPEFEYSDNIVTSNMSLLASRISNLSVSTGKLMTAFLSGKLNGLKNGTLLNLTTLLIDQFEASSVAAERQLAAGSDLFASGGDASLSLMKVSSTTAQQAIDLVEAAVTAKREKADLAFQSRALDNLANFRLAKDATEKGANIILAGISNLSSAMNESKSASKSAYRNIRFLGKVIDESLKDKLYTISTDLSDYRSIPEFADAAIISHALSDVLHLFTFFEPPKLVGADFKKFFTIFNMSISEEIKSSLNRLTDALESVKRDSEHQHEFFADLEVFKNSTLAKSEALRNRSVSIRRDALAAKDEIFHILDSRVFNSTQRAAKRVSESEQVINNLVQNMLGSIKSAR